MRSICGSLAKRPKGIPFGVPSVQGKGKGKGKKIKERRFGRHRTVRFSWHGEDRGFESRSEYHPLSASARASARARARARARR